MLKSTAKLFLLAVALGLVFSGCVNTKRTYYINPDGSGKVELESISPIEKKDRSKPDFLHKNLLSFIKNSKGIDGWGKLTTEFKKGNAVAVKGVAYFKDINKVKFSNMEISDHAFNKNATGITLEFFKGMRSKKKTPPEKLDAAVKKEMAEFKQIIVGFCKLKDAIRFDYTFHLPGKIGSAHIFDRLDSRKARLLITGDGVCNGLRAGMGDEKVVRAAMKTGSSEPTKRAFLKGMFGTTGHPKLVVRGPFQPLFDYEAEAIPARKYTAALLKNLPILLARSKQKRIDRERQAANPQKYAEEKRKREAAKKRRAAFRRDFKGPTWRDPVTGMEFVPVLGGSFEMGCHEQADQCFGEEGPARTVRLDGFWMGR
ncbi:MAG: hypothetical protein IIC64_07305, partial [SAR324 cluster bacterium]|nr:hypothetical protein [SAR324 cluster bacterium]